MLGSAQRGGELDHHLFHHQQQQQHLYQQLGSINNYCFTGQQDLQSFPKEYQYVLGVAEEHDHRHLLQHHHDHRQLQPLRSYGLAVEPTSVLDLWSPSPSSKGGGCCSGGSSSGGLNDHVAARLAATTAATHGSPLSFDDNRSNTSEKSVEAARKFLDQEEEELRRRKNTTTVSSRFVGWKSGGEEEAAARRGRDKSLDEWLADLQQQQQKLHLPATEVEEELELTSSRGLVFQSPPGSSSSNTDASRHRQEVAAAEIFPTPPPPPPPLPPSSSSLEHGHHVQQQYGMEELERMLLSPSSGGGGASNHHQQQLAKWLLGEQQDHHYFPARDEELLPAGFIARDPAAFFPSPPNPSLLDPSRCFSVIQQPQASRIPPQDMSLEQLFHPPPLVDLSQFSKNAGPSVGHLLHRTGPSEKIFPQHRIDRESFQEWDMDRKRKAPQLENQYPTKILDLGSSKNTGTNNFVSPPVFAAPPWQQPVELDHPSSKLQRLEDERYRNCRGEALVAPPPPPPPPLPVPVPAAIPTAIPANIAVSVPDEGLGLMDQLLHLAQAIDVGSNDVARSILARLNQHLFCHQGKRIQRLAFYFKEALAARMADNHQQQHHQQHSATFDILHTNTPPPLSRITSTTLPSSSSSSDVSNSTAAASTSRSSSSSSPAEIFTRVKAYTSYCELSPLLRFAYLSANQAILESIQGEAAVHIIDYDPGYGSQWAALLEDVARTPPPLPQPRLRLTLAGPDRSRLEFVAESLRDYAVDLQLQHRPQIGLVEMSQPGEMTAALLGVAEGEAVVVNFMFSLHRCLAVRGGAEAAVRSVVAAASPRLVTVAEQEVDDNDGKFQRRFVETLQYYAFVLDSLGPEDGAGVLTVERDILSPDIANAVSFEGWRRTERHERLAQWRGRLGRAGLEGVPLGEAARMQAECLIKGHSHGKNFEVCREEGALLLGWQGKPLVAVSAWTPASCSSAVEGSHNSGGGNNNSFIDLKNSNGNASPSNVNIINKNNNNKC